jgi:hypothetical protein
MPHTDRNVGHPGTDPDDDGREVPDGFEDPRDSETGDSKTMTLRFQRRTTLAPSSRVEVRFPGDMEIVHGRDSQRVDSRTYRGRVQLLPNNLELRGEGPVTVTNLTGNALLSPGKVKVFVSGPDGEENVPLVQYGSDEEVVISPGESVTIEAETGGGEGGDQPETDPGTGPNYDDGQPGTGPNLPGVTPAPGGDDSEESDQEGNDEASAWDNLLPGGEEVGLVLLVLVGITIVGAAS